jgi:hypothetical protein
MKFDNRNSAVSSERRTQVSTAVLVTSITAALGIGIFISSPIVVAATDAAQSALAAGKVPNSIATHATKAGVLGSNITFGNPQFIGTEYDKTTSLKPATVNGTHVFLVVFMGNGVLNGVKVTDNGKGFITNKSDGGIYSQGEGVWMASNGSNGMATYSFQGIGHYGAGGKLKDIITDLQTKATGKLAFLSNGLYRLRTPEACSRLVFVCFITVTL